MAAVLHALTVAVAFRSSAGFWEHAVTAFSGIAKKTCVILDRDKYRYQNFVSDIAGQDIRGHRNSVPEAVKAVRNWHASHASHGSIPSADKINRRFTDFSKALPGLCKAAHLKLRDLIFKERVEFTAEWTQRVPI